MTINVTLDSRFNTLNNGSQRIRIRQNTVTKEREAIVNVALSSETPDGSGLSTVNFSGIRGFTKVYAVDIIRNPFLNGHVSFVRATNDSAATGQLHFVDFTGTDITSALTDETYDVIIRGV